MMMCSLSTAHSMFVKTHDNSCKGLVRSISLAKRTGRADGSLECVHRHRAHAHIRMRQIFVVTGDPPSP
eukprot:267253-Chlamydomonas_euryale.AAC.1